MFYFYTLFFTFYSYLLYAKCYQDNKENHVIRCIKFFILCII